MREIQVLSGLSGIARIVEWDYVRAGRSSSASSRLERRIVATTEGVVRSIVQLYGDSMSDASAVRTPL
jgi:hypothetical protein